MRIEDDAHEQRDRWYCDRQSIAFLNRRAIPFRKAFGTLCLIGEFGLFVSGGNFARFSARSELHASFFSRERSQPDPSGKRVGPNSGLFASQALTVNANATSRWATTSLRNRAQLSRGDKTDGRTCRQQGCETFRHGHQPLTQSSGAGAESGFCRKEGPYLRRWTPGVSSESCELRVAGCRPVVAGPQSKIRW